MIPNLAKKGYNDKDFKTISLQAFHSPAIREAMTTWEENGTFLITNATIEAINNIKNQYPRIAAWGPTSILQQISKNWSSRNILKNQKNKEKLKLIKHYDLKKEWKKTQTTDILQKKLSMKNC